MESITPAELRRRLDSEEELVLLDVREPWEFELCRIEGSINIPMMDLQGKLDEVQPNGNIVVICHHGARSWHAARFLESAGFAGKIMNLDGGVEAWAVTVEPGMKRY